MKRARSKGVEIAYDLRGPAAEPLLLCMPGWCSDRTLFAAVGDRLARSRRVAALDWRGHGDSGPAPVDFGLPELVEDALAVITATGAQQVVPVAISHAGWVAIELRRRLGPRVPAVVLLDWLVLDPPAPFLQALAALQDPERWRPTREQLFALWLESAPAAVADQVRREMGRYGFEMWSRAGRAIAAAYERHGDPLRALLALNPPPVLHLYAQPPAPEYLAAQQEFAQRHPWFSVRRLEAVSHFPALEVPDAVAEAVERFLGKQA